MIGVVMGTMFEMLKNIWLNCGWQHPWISSAIAALVGLACWWIFGGFVALSLPRANAQSEASPAPSQASANQQANKQTIGSVSGGSTVNQAGGNITITYNYGGGQDAIPGTKVSNAQLKETFPFGYV